MHSNVESTSVEKVLAVCRRALKWARDRDYRGYSKFDALNSPLLRAVSSRSAFLRKAFVFALSRSPVNIRPLLLVRRAQNPWGLAMFARAYLNLHRITGEQNSLDEARRLLNVLLDVSQHEHYSGHCWGYEHPWQNSAFFIPAYEPNTAVTVNVAEAFLDAHAVTGSAEYLDVCQSTARFLQNDLRRIRVPEGMHCVSYDLHSDWKVININAMAAAFLAKVHEVRPHPDTDDLARSMMRWVLSQQTPEAAWYYTDPPNASRITIDNYHTGFILDALDDYAAVTDTPPVRHAWRRGLAFYEENLFEPDGAPYWMADRRYPRDINACAQAVLTFLRAAKDEPRCRNVARRVLTWTLRHMYEPNVGRFHYQKTRYWTKRFTLMRWCQAWMAYVLSSYAVVEARS